MLSESDSMQGADGFISRYGNLAKRFLLWLFLAALLLVTNLWQEGKGELAWALFLGYGLGAVYIWSMAVRLWRSSLASDGKGTREMLFGFALRFFMLFAALFAAVHVSAEVFGVFALGFLVFYALALVSGIFAISKGEI